MTPNHKLDDYLRLSNAILEMHDRPGHGLRGLIGEDEWARMHEPPEPPTWRERIAAAWRCLRGDIGE